MPVKPNDRHQFCANFLATGRDRAERLSVVTYVWVAQVPSMIRTPLPNYREVREKRESPREYLLFKVYLRERIKGLFPALSRVVDGVVEAPGPVGIFHNPGMMDGDGLIRIV